MFGLRYHVASLAAVFIALAVGILLGVAVSGKLTDVGEGAELQNLRDDNERLQQDREAAQAAADAASDQGEGSAELFARTYPTLMDGRLEGKNVGVVFLGPSDGSIRAEVEGALADADGGAPARVVALDVPVDDADLRDVLEGDELFAAYVDDEGDYSDLGRELGQELAEEDDTLWSVLASQLVEEQSGSATEPIDAAIVVRTWTPPGEEDGADAVEESEATSSLLDGLVRGLDGAGIPVVGVADGETPTEVLEAYRDQGISSVDDIDVPAGRLALVLLLAGAEPGHYGFGDGATDGVVPPIEPLPVEGE
ncbi:MAG: copper transporter [Gaiellaceae bacterium]